MMPILSVIRGRSGRQP